jgi:DHA2 family multidrug resistance protein
MGYTAQLAGMVISPGGITIMIMMPLVGFLIQRIDPRYLVAFGFTVTTIALLHMRTLYPDVSFGYAASLRIYQTIGLAFLFVPINTMAYTGVRQDQNNDVSGLTNLARNIGGSVGTAFFITMLARREQFHQARLGDALHPSNPLFQQRVTALKSFFQHAGGLTSSPETARVFAYGNIYNQLKRQATALAYVDVIQLLAIGCACMLPLVFLLKKRKAAAPPAAH